MEIVCSLTQNFIDQRRIGKIWNAGGVGVLDIVGKSSSTPMQGNNLPFSPANQNLNGQQGEETQASNFLPAMTKEESTSMDN